MAQQQVWGAGTQSVPWESHRADPSLNWSPGPTVGLHTAQGPDVPELWLVPCFLGGYSEIALAIARISQVDISEKSERFQ